MDTWALCRHMNLPDLGGCDWAPGTWPHLWAYPLNKVGASSAGARPPVANPSFPLRAM
jgi:hypothetical protein